MKFRLHSVSLLWRILFSTSIAITVLFAAMGAHYFIRDNERHYDMARSKDKDFIVIEGAVHRLRPKLMTVCVVLASLIPILRETGVGSDVMKPIAAPIVGGMITSTIHVLILVPVFFALMKERELRRGTLQSHDRQ